MTNSRPQIKRVLGKAPPHSGFAVISTARNERYFWPHFVSHYRSYGTTHFIVLDDNSEDGSLDWLSSQPDVSVYKSALGFAQTVGKLRFGIAARGLLARHFCPDRWALIADLDEFWVPPPEYQTFTQLAAALEANNHFLCRGLMLDCFPRRLADLVAASTEDPPNRVAPFSDDLSPISWPAEDASARLQSRRNVRNRITRMLLERGLVSLDHVRERGDPTLHKAPLAKWVNGVSMLSAHRLHAPYNAQHQMICGHYKFYPGWEAKVQTALQTQSYYNDSIEYKTLALAELHLQNTSLKGEYTAPFDVLTTQRSLLF